MSEREASGGGGEKEKRGAKVRSGAPDTTSDAKRQRTEEPGDAKLVKEKPYWERRHIKKLLKKPRGLDPYDNETWQSSITPYYEAMRGPPWTMMELRLNCLTGHVRDKPLWYHKMGQAEVRARWEQEMREQGVPDTCIRYAMSMLQHQAQEALVSPGGITPAAVPQVFMSDCLIPEELRASLMDGVRALEDQPHKDWHPGSDQQVLDLVHPSLYCLVRGRTKVVLDPPTGFADWRLLMGQGVTSKAFKSRKGRTIYNYEEIVELFTSRTVQWLPAEVVVSKGGKVRFDSYINNLHPVEHRTLYPVLSRLLERMLPLFETVLAPLADYHLGRFRHLSPLQPGQVDWWMYPEARPDSMLAEADVEEDITNDYVEEDDEDEDEDEEGEKEEDGEKEGAQGDGGEGQGMAVGGGASAMDEEEAEEQQEHEGKEEEEDEEEDDEENEDDEVDEVDEDDDDSDEDDGDSDYSPACDMPRWPQKRDLRLKYSSQCDALFIPPFVPEVYTPPDQLRTGRRLSGRRLQVIVKLANIHLTPDKPSYPGGKWHLEGMANENIVATAIYYYDSHNIKDTRLDFRASVHVPEDDGDDDDVPGLRLMYGVDPDAELMQMLGSVGTPQGRCLGFANIYQHRLEPFELADPSMPGHRKILVFWLINPDWRILSTAHVPPQQRDWFWGPGRTWQWLGDRLPRPLSSDLMTHVLSFLDTPMIRQEAEEWRDVLMKERTVIQSDEDRVFSTELNLCEH